MLGAFLMPHAQRREPVGEVDSLVVTNLRLSDEGVVKFYNGRRTAEQWIKEAKNAVKWTRLSCHDFVDKQVRLQLFALAYNLGGGS